MATAQRRIPQKTKIKPPKRHGPEISIDETWSRLSNNIREIHNHNASNLSFEENYRYAYNMVLHKHGDQLYRGVNQLVAENIENLSRARVVPAFPTVLGDDLVQQSQEGELLLKALKDVWDDHISSMNKLRDILKYMDRVHTKSNDLPEIWECGLNLFYKHLIRPPMKDHVMSAILRQIYIERERYTINRSTVKGCVDILLQLDRDAAEDSSSTPSVGRQSLYHRHLEPAIFEQSETYYKAEGLKLLDTCDASEFLRRVEKRFEEEEMRTHHYLSSQSAAPLQQILKNTLLTPHLNAIVSQPNSGLDAMIELDRTEDLARMYRLFIMVPAGLPCLRKSFKDAIIRRGRATNSLALGDSFDDVKVDVDVEDDSSTKKGKGKARPQNSAAQTLSLALQWVQSVLDLKAKFDRLWEVSLQKDRDIEGSFTEAFANFVNGNDKSPEFISLFIDDHLKKGLKGKTDTDVDLVLDQTITVFRYIAEKDVFERYYKGHLAKRLLLGRSVSDDAERGMLAKLKVECGVQFTQKMEGMFTDMKISNDTMHAFQNYLQNVEPPDVDISVIVMTSTFWPVSHIGATCTLPEVLVNSCQTFEKFYHSRHVGRRLTWQPSLGNADVKVQFKTKRHDLNVSTFALVILLLFDQLSDEEFLTFSEIKAATNIPDHELQRHLQSLACAKYKVLRKHPPGRDVSLDDSFSFNTDFSAPLQKIKISTIASKVESGEERKETRDRVEEERRHQTEACIVRIMKDRKHATHVDLVNEVIRQLSTRFTPNALNIKKRIENLIEREYLERCEDRKSYNYMA